jgi:hypothetical protein
LGREFSFFFKILGNFWEIFVGVILFFWQNFTTFAKLIEWEKKKKRVVHPSNWDPSEIWLNLKKP